MTDFAAARFNMVECQVRPSDVTDVRIQEAMSAIPREAFAPKAKQSLAYMDATLAVASNRYLIEPRCFAKLVQAARIEEDDLILDLGCGTGYSSAILAALGAAVVAVESDPNLVELASQTLTHLEVDNAAVIEGDIAAGAPAQGPFDVIFINGAVEQIPQTLFDQLTLGGRLAAVVKTDGKSSARVYLKSSEGDGTAVLGHLDVFDAAIPPFPEFEKPKGFVF